MPAARDAAIPAAPRKALLAWIEHDDDDTTGHTQPACSKQAEALHARILLDAAIGSDPAAEPLQPPSGLRLPPLG
jgi:hypothetical protein